MAHLKGMETLLSKKLAVSDQAIGTDTATPGASRYTGACREARGSQRSALSQANPEQALGPGDGSRNTVHLAPAS